MEDLDWDMSDEEYDSDNDALFESDEEEDQKEQKEDKNDKEYNKDKNIEKEIKEKKSIPVMTKFEKSNIISGRIQQINKSKCFIYHGKKVLSIIEDELIEKGISEPFEIANIEFDKGKLPPYKLKRAYFDGSYEIWRHNDFEFFPN